MDGPAGETIAPAPGAERAERAKGDAHVANARGRGDMEYSARTVDEAIAQALTQLGLEREDVDVEVLHAGSPGRLLGFGAEPARVRVRPLAGVAAPAAAAAPA